MNQWRNNKAALTVFVLLIFAVATIYGVRIYDNHQAKSKAQNTRSNCDPNYSGYCVPNVSYDLDCKDIQHRVKVIGTDDDNFDADGDGVGCESY